MTTANPAIVIGLGGTGQWVVTYLKKNLMDTYGGVPNTIKLLAFDTTSEKSEAEVEVQPGEERAQVGNVTLDTGEFIYLGGNIRRICQEIARENKHPHIGSWLQASYYLRAHDDDAYDISKGAGRRRQFGRMAVFYDLATGTPQVTGKIQQAITAVKSARQRIVPIEIYIICSLAGGTGSGMFVDIAHLARVLANRAEVPCAVRGFIVLQNTFAPVARIDDVQPSAFAAMRELERFMLVFDRDYPMYYTDNPRRHELQTIYRSKLFDNCYLLDARRTTMPLDNYAPRRGVFPSVAECITVLLDPETGNTFELHYKNVNDRLAKSQVQENKALYSSLGTFSYILPVEDIIERNTLKLAREVIERRLVGIHRNSETGTIRLDSSQVLELNAPPRDEALAFLRMDRSSSNVQNIQFCKNVAWALGQPLDQQPTIDQMAGLGVELVSWLQPVEQDKEIVQAGERIQNVLQTNLLASVPNSKVMGGEDFQSGANRIDGAIQSIRHRLLGVEEQSGRATPGELQSGLVDYARRNRDRFRRLLTEKLLLLLNGTTDNQVAAKTAKLPYTHEFLQFLAQSFEDFGKFVERVIAARATGGGLAQAQEFVTQTRQYMFDSVHATGVMDRLRGTAVKAQDAFIENQDYLFTLEREALLYQALLNLISDLKSIVQEAKAEVDQWVAYLALGSTPESGEIGVYHALVNREAELKRRRELEQRVVVYKYLTDEAYEDYLYNSRINDTRMGEILRRFEWRLPEGGKFDLRLYYSVPRRGQNPEDEPHLLRSPAHRGEKATEHNVTLLLGHLRPYFHDIRSETIADRMEESLTAGKAAKELLDSAGALVSYTPDRQSLAEKHNFVCTNPGRQVTYFNTLESELQKSAPNDKDNQVTGLTNKHRCIILSTMDLIIGQNVDPYITAAESYKNYIGDHKLLHSFPAEVNATEFEERLSKPPLKEAHRLLSPELVGLLEDKEMARRFILALVYGLVREEAVSDNSESGSRKTQHVLRLDTRSRRQRRTDSWTVRLTQPSDRPRLLDAMTNFVFVHLDPERGTRAIKDVTPGTSILIAPEQVDQAVHLRERCIENGMEGVVEAFAQMLHKPATANLLQPGGDLVLISAFRQFLFDHERALRRSDTELINRVLDELVADNDDCYEAQFKEELTRQFRIFLEGYKGGEQIVPDGKGKLIKILETFIDDKVELLRGKRAPKERGERTPEDQLTKDLGSIMYLFLWDEVERIERLNNQ